MNQITKTGSPDPDWQDKPLNQPLRFWLSDRIQDFRKSLQSLEDPSVLFEVDGITMEVRLMHIPNEFTRETIEDLH